MAGKIKNLIDTIIENKSKGSNLIKLTLKTKLVLKGVDPDHYSETSPDNPEILEKLKELARELNISID